MSFDLFGQKYGFYNHVAGPILALKALFSAYSLKVEIARTWAMTGHNLGRVVPLGPRWLRLRSRNGQPRVLGDQTCKQ